MLSLAHASRLGAAALAAIALVSGAARAHHSTAMFDADSMTEFEGAVKEFQWTNPHTWLQVLVENDAGEVVEWSLEWSSPNTLGRRGVRPNSFTPGEHVVIQVNPMRNGAPGGWLVSAKFDDGRVIGNWRETSIEAAAN